MTSSNCTNIAHAILSGGRADAPAIFCGDVVLTHGQLRQWAYQWAARLLQEGLVKGDRVGLMAENGPGFAAAYLGAILAGLCIVPLPLNGREAAMRQAIGATGMKRIIVSARHRQCLQTLAAGSGVPLLDESEAAASAPADPAALPAIDPYSDLAAIMLTSGSAGDAKGVMVTHRNIEANTRDIFHYIDLGPDDRAMVVLPFYYCYGASLLHTHLMAGASLVINNRFLFPETVLDELDKRQCTGLAGVPSTYQILLRKSRFARRHFPALRWLQQAGGRLANPFLREIRQAFPQVRLFVMYGQTEATARLSYLPPERLDDKLGSIGKGLPGNRLEVLLPDGSPVRPGSDQVGEIVASGDSITRGYWNDPEETHRFYRQGRLYTGDLARVDADGFIYIVERARDFIKSMGNRVSPREVEEVLAQLPEVVEAAVIGVPDEIWGEALKAYITCTAPGRLTANTVRLHCQRQLPNYMIPEQVEFLARMPKTANGKIDKQELKRLHSQCGADQGLL